ncbi:MAG TPA: HD domain-containing phosphohydrolase, partial [Desulfobacterales bacterium]|nr:HD domain-containing phosphohydrolase [Desulfobacterales bacterium]
MQPTPRRVPQSHRRNNRESAGKKSPPTDRKGAIGSSPFLPGLRRWGVLLFLPPLLLFGGLLGNAHGQPPREVKIGVLAKRGSAVDVGMWAPTADYLSAKLAGRHFQVVPLDFTQIHAAVREQRIDFVLANSAFYVELEKLYGVNRIATLINQNLPGQQTTTFGGVIFARADRQDLRAISDLRGQAFMAVEPRSFGGWIMCWRELYRLGLDPLHFFATLEYGNTHDAVVYAVRNGLVDAGTVRTDTLERMAAAGSIRLDEFRIIDERYVVGFPFRLSTQLYPEWPMAATRAAPIDLARAVAAALLAMDPDDPAARASKSAGWTVPLNYQPVHDCLLDLRIGPYADFGQFTLTDVVRRYWRQLGLLLGLVTLVSSASLYILRLNRKLRTKKREVDELNRTLEARVVERTEQINTLLDRELYLREIMETVAEINGLLLSATDLETLLDQACKTMAEHGHYGYSWIGLLRGGVVDAVFTADDSVRFPGAPPYDPVDPADPFSSSPAARCMLSDQTVVIVQSAGETTVAPWLDPSATTGFQAVAALPLRADRYTRAIGALSVYTMRKEGFDQEELVMLEELAGDIGFAVSSFWQREKVSRLERERTENYEQTIRSFAEMIDQRDTYTAGHTLRVAAYSRLLARELGLDDDQIGILQQAATLHDIGKIATPDSVLLKPGKLSELDYALIKLHPAAGHAMLANINRYKGLAEIIRHHHERYDGAGYPDGLRGKKIPLLSRIIVVADAFDAMTTNRIYKPRKTVAEALQEMELLSGSQFDPEIVTAALRVLKDVEIPEAIDQLPKSQMEQRRFSYFFGDKLTGLYNEDYLQIILQNDQVLASHRCLHIFHLKNLPQFNRQQGWEQGNRLIQRFAAELQARYRDALLFRAYGRDFVVITR